ncbi:MAG: fibronectin type III domain-containing protein, partial [Calditrichota bacterium]
MKRISIFFITLIVVSFQNLIAQTDSLRISWNPNPEADMLEYRVYRSVNSTTNFQVIQTVPHPQVQTVDRNSIQPGNLYAFRLTAVDAAGNQSVPSEIVSVGIPQVVWTVTQIPSGSPTTVPLSSFINDPDNTAGEMAITISNQNNVTAAVNGSNLVLTPNPLAYIGSAGFSIRIEDPDGFWDIANVQLNINLVTNQPPVVSNIPNQTIAEGQNFTTISLDNYVADPDNADNQITWTYSGNTALNVSISSARVATITVP